MARPDHSARRGRRTPGAKTHAEQRRRLRRRLEAKGLFPSDVDAAVAELRHKQRRATRRPGPTDT